MNFWYGSQKYIGVVFTVHPISGFLVNTKPDWTFLVSCMDQIGLVVSTARQKCDFYGLQASILLFAVDNNILISRCNEWLRYLEGPVPSRDQA